jgi:hypothetical protein
MDYARATRTPAHLTGPRRTLGLGAKRKLRTGPLPTVPWRELDRKTSIEQHLPVMILLAFGLLAAIQVLLSQ